MSDKPLTSYTPTPHCVSVKHSMLSCMCARLSYAQMCEGCRKWLDRAELSVSNEADYDYGDSEIEIEDDNFKDED